MSKSLSLKLREDIYEDTEKLRKKNKTPRNMYINKALDFFNKIQKRKNLAVLLKKESMLVSKNSMAVLEEFENMGDY